jgi:hypothetical protein
MLREILTSPRVVIALAAFSVGVLIMAVPQLVSVQAELLTLTITLALALITGETITEAAAIARQQQLPADIDISDLMRDVIDAVLDAVEDRLSD